MNVTVTKTDFGFCMVMDPSRPAGHESEFDRQQRCRERADDIIEKSARHGVGEDGEHWCTVSCGASAFEGYGNSREEAQSHVWEQVCNFLMEEDELEAD